MGYRDTRRPKSCEAISRDAKLKGTLSVGLNIRLQQGKEAVSQYPASGNQPSDRLLTADDNSIVQGSASQLNECFQENGYALPNSRCETHTMLKLTTFGVLRHSSHYSIRTGTLKHHRVEAGIDEICQWKVAKLDNVLANFVSSHRKYHHGIRHYTPMANQVTGLSVPGLHTWTRVALINSATSDEPLQRKIPVAMWLRFVLLTSTPHEQAIQRHMGVYLTATLDYRVPICSATSKCVNTEKPA
ncbi:hypothetical protein BO83DRAFT_387906 [Aspergillus eucalypticola CBS 122712]|uniref:Uncharacterized protein n=1 Tax=Aspergillus eucalypticola (strain CBS 122712 / IBT 29274) TaxID=1448314 RepID=A0A317VPQ6_ASPEC|nr:uncharacterized protein BO83DRAFT_387906 [Aspergillus eucalypticola CBS 122712]PWY75915.1 hypothetical protein BO83DRAFT_387906 [Aspergillus eucalypticola CBS 122712]